MTLSLNLHWELKILTYIHIYIQVGGKYLHTYTYTYRLEAGDLDFESKFALGTENTVAGHHAQAATYEVSACVYVCE